MGESFDYANDLPYVESSVNSRNCDVALDAFERDLQTRRRFFNRQAEDLFGRHFC
jgi:hypothetical protein